MALSEARKKATYKYKAKSYEYVQLTLYKGNRELLKAKAEEVGMSVNEYIISLLAREIPGINERRDLD